ncbi:MAG: glycosyltransferase family 39 protein, partial [Planctomycetota bacterium]
GFRLHAFPAPLENDECNYAYFAQRLLAGDRLYVDLWDHQPPGIFALLVLPTAVFGSSLVVYRTLALMLVLLTMVGVFDLARRWFGRTAAWTAALLFAVASSDPGVAGEGCNREIYMNLLLVAAVWTLARRPTANLRSLLAAGLLIGLASTIKTVVALHWLALLPVVVLLAARGKSGQERCGTGILPVETQAGSLCHRFCHGLLAGADTIEKRRPTLVCVAAFAAGPAAIWLATLAYFAATGRAQGFCDAAFAYNLVYSETDQGWGRRLIAFFFKGDNLRVKVFGTALALWLSGTFGLSAFPWRRDRIRSALMAGWVLGSYLAVCLPGRFWPHYYLLMLPPLVLLAAALVYRIEIYHRRLSRGAAAVILLALLATQIPGYLLVEPDRIGWDRYGPRMSWARDLGRRVAAVTDPADTIYVWSYDVGVYTYSGRRCASRFTMNGPLLPDHPSTAARRRCLLDDLVRNQPRLIIIPHGKEPPFAELQRFLVEHRYITVGQTSQMEVLCDLNRPIPPIDWTEEPK